eukprot:2945560-Pyramimonas_sp.AAC.1
MRYTPTGRGGHGRRRRGDRSFKTKTQHHRMVVKVHGALSPCKLRYQGPPHIYMVAGAMIAEMKHVRMMLVAVPCAPPMVSKNCHACYALDDLLG